MAAPRLSIKDNGSWQTVEVPYINVGGGTAGWKAIHNVWIKNGGTWKLAHKTAKTNSVYSAQTSITYTSDFSYTVSADGTRYLEITMHGHNGGGGGGITSVNTKGGTYNGAPILGHRTCPYPGNYVDTATETATGGAGGTGGLANFVLEVKPGEVYKGTFLGQGAWAGSWDQDMSYDTNYSAGTTLTGNGGGGGSAVTLVDYPYSDTSVAVGGGQGGSSGILTVTATCYEYGARGYTVSTTTGAAGANGVWGVTNGSRIWQTISTGSGSGSGGYGGSTGSSGSGSTGTTQPYIKIIPYKSNYGTI